MLTSPGSRTLRTRGVAPAAGRTLSARGETVFHSINWGGYLTWHGWDARPRFKTWIDDRIDVHGRRHTQEYFDIMAARPGWHEQLDKHHVDLLCLPVDSHLARQAAHARNCKELFRQQNVVVFRRTRSTASSNDSALMRPGERQG